MRVVVIGVVLAGAAFYFWPDSTVQVPSSIAITPGVETDSPRLSDSHNPFVTLEHGSANGPLAGKETPEVIASTAALTTSQPAKPNWSSLSLDEQVALLEEELGLEYGWLWRSNDVEARVQRLYEVMTSSEDASVAFPLTYPLTEQQVMLSEQGYAPGSGTQLADQFSPDSRSLYAHFWLPEDSDADTVLVKWSNLDTGEVLHVKAYAVDANDPVHYSWLRNNEGWQEGRYRVRYYGMDEQVESMAVSDFDVSSTPASSGSFHTNLDRPGS